MKTRPRLRALAVAAALVTGRALAQEVPAKVPEASATGADPWSFYASALVYFPPESQDYLSPVLTADRGRLHLEARYNYEGSGPDRCGPATTSAPARSSCAMRR